MEIANLRLIAEAVENALLEKSANKEIGDYSMHLIPDDQAIEIVYHKIVPIKNIKVTLKVPRTI